MIELEALLVAIPGESPCGPDMEYITEFTDLAKKAAGEPERVMGTATKAAVPPDWVFVRENAQFLLREKSKDLRVAVLLTRAFTRIDGAEGLLAGLTVVKELLARYWQGVHPRPDPETGDPLMRVNTIAELGTVSDLGDSPLLDDVRAMYLVRPSAKGRVSVRDALNASGKIAAGGEAAPPNMSELAGVLLATRSESEASLAAMRSAVQVTAEIQTTIAEKLAADLAARAADAPKIEFPQAPDLEALVRILKATIVVVGGVLGVNTEPLGPDGETPQDQRLESGGAHELRSRDDVARLIAKLCEFIERTEPTNPAPLLLRRAGRLMNKNFIEIIKDLAPGGVGEIENIAGPDDKT